MWVERVQLTEDLAVVLQAIDHFEAEYKKGLADLDCVGRISEAEGRLPGQTAYHMANQKDLEIINRILDLRVERVEQRYYKKYKETYNRDLSQREIDRYLAGEDEVYHIRNLHLRFARTMNLYASLIKGLEIKHYQLTNITKLRAAGLDDAMFD
jgi:hypothetical protein